MPTFSKRSLQRLKQVHPHLQQLCHSVIADYDFTVLCGYRDPEDQEKAYREGRSKARFGQSPHNGLPALAVDVASYPVDWNDISRFEELG